MESANTKTSSTGTSPTSDSASSEHPVLSHNPSTTPEPGPSSTTSSTPEKTLSSGSISQEKSPPGTVTSSTSELPTQAISPSSIETTHPPLPTTSPLSRTSNSQPDQGNTGSVTVNAVPQSTKRPNATEQVASPSRGAFIAFGVLSGFFVVLIISLLLWRRRRNSKLIKKDALAMVEELQIPTKTSTEKPASSCSGTNTSNTNTSTTPLLVEPRGRPDEGATPPGSRTLLRPTRPPSMQLNPRLNTHELSGHDGRLLKADRPSSWRSSIASVWETLGLPSRVLQDSHAWDSASLHSQRTGRNLLRTSFIAEEAVLAPTPSASATRTSHSPTLSSHSFGPSRPPSSGPPSPSGTFSFRRPRRPSLDLESYCDRSSTTASGPQTEDSHTTTSDHPSGSPVVLGPSSRPAAPPIPG